MIPPDTIQAIKVKHARVASLVAKLKTECDSMEVSRIQAAIAQLDEAVGELERD